MVEKNKIIPLEIKRLMQFVKCFDKLHNGIIARKE